MTFYRRKNQSQKINKKVLATASVNFLLSAPWQEKTFVNYSGFPTERSARESYFFVGCSLAETQTTPATFRKEPLAGFFLKESMAWIESHEELGDHWKTQALAARLGCSVPTAIGHLHLLWYFTLKVSWKSGSLSKYPAKTIARACWWEGDSDIFIKSLIESGWIDKLGLVVHDWHEYAKHIIYQRVYNEKRRKESSYSNSTAVNTDEPQRGKSATLPNHTLPNLKEKTLSTKVDPPPALDEDAPTPEKLIRLWNEKAHPNLPRVAMLTDKRRLHIKARLKEHNSKLFWEDLIERVNRAPLLRGENGRDWKCNFDWILNVNNMAKILEGNYDLARRSA